MTSRSPFDRSIRSIPVTVVTAPSAPDDASGDVELIRIAPGPHDHALGAECPACAARGDIRALLFDRLEAARQGLRPAFSRVVVDARALADPAPIIDALTPGRVPAIGLRDHAVARNFHLAGVIGDRR